MLKKSWF